MGSELLRQISHLGCERIIGIDNNESELFFQSQSYADRDDIRLFICDLRDREEIMRKMRGIDLGWSIQATWPAILPLVSLSKAARSTPRARTDMADTSCRPLKSVIGGY